MEGNVVQALGEESDVVGFCFATAVGEENERDVVILKESEGLEAAGDWSRTCPIC